MSTPIVVSPLVFCAAALLVHLMSLSIAIIRQRFDPSVLTVGFSTPVSILRPICGLSNNIADTLESTFILDYPCYDIIFLRGLGGRSCDPFGSKVDGELSAAAGATVDRL